MEKNKNLKKSTQAGLRITMVLVVIGILFNLFTLITQFKDRPLDFRVHMCIYTCVYVLILLYSLWGYKKPHGNMLRYVTFAFGAFILLTFIFPGAEGPAALIVIDTLCRGFAAILVTYVSGRLDKIRKNKPLMVLVGVLIMISTILRNHIFPVFNLMGFLSSLSFPISWAVLGNTYVAHYEQHKSAGLNEEKK